MADQHDIQRSILDMQTKRSKLGLRKQRVQAQIAEIKEQLKYIVQGHETFNELAAKKRALVSETMEIDEEIAEIKSNIKKRENLKEEVKTMHYPEMKVLQTEITFLRDKYLNFAGDKTRIASMRAMSGEFAEELTKLLKRSKLNV